ncbi:MAG TPA: creatininase family protein [Casimicrobiaceae bacterium]|nr:creatininase family protein [Casimicrobiaceae bacterium]
MLRDATCLPILALAALACFASAGLAATTPPTLVTLDAMTSPELAARIAHGTTTVIVPIGGTEQNGPYMTLGKHNARVEALATRIAEALGNAVVAPVVTYVPEGAVSPPSGHMRYPGTVSVPDRAFEATLEGIAASFRQHGFRDIVFLGDHGGYQASLARVATRLDKAWAASPARVHAIPEYYRASSAGFDKTLAARGYTAAEIGTHAGLADTALALAAAPSVVRADALHSAVNPASAPGVAGNPARATAELGALGVDAIVTSTVAAIRAAVARH